MRKILLTISAAVLSLCAVAQSEKVVNMTIAPVFNINRINTVQLDSFAISWNDYYKVDMKKDYSNKLLTDNQEAQNSEKSKTCARVENVLGFMEQSMNGLASKSIGIIRATGIIGLINPTYKFVYTNKLFS